MSQNLLDQIKEAQRVADIAKNMLEVGKKTAENAIKLAQKEATKEDRAKAQKASIQLDALLKKASKGEDVSKEIEEYSKQFKKDFNK